MIDVMCVADCLWERMAATSREILSRPFGGKEESRPWIRLLVALHDAGKATPEFVWKILEDAELRLQAGLISSGTDGAHHGVSGVPLLTSWLVDASKFDVPLSPTIARCVAGAVVAHHGEFAEYRATQSYESYIARWIDHGTWKNAHEVLLSWILEAATDGRPLPEWCIEGKYPPAEFTALLAGLTSVADWIGSNTDHFPYEALPLDLAEYRKKSRARALRALDDVGWTSGHRSSPRAFEELFGFAPRALQITTQSVLDHVDRPSLVIIESSMGDGKTEAALLVAEHATTRLGQHGLFFGLPTQATSNQMLRRIERFLRRTALEPANLHLTHGDAALSSDYGRLRSVYDSSEKSAHGAGVSAAEWFVKKKRTLLADHAVGTIDQALLAVLWTRHNFVRLFGLAGKVIVLDEVHAYDTYTSKLLDNLLSWLSALGCTVVLLSATLPRTRRLELLQAFGASAPEAEAPYPRISLGMRARTALTFATTPSRSPQRIRLKRCPDEAVATAAELVDAISSGGCAAWICNSVSRAQHAFVAAREALRAKGLDEVECHLLHSRFLKKDRFHREKMALEAFGPPDDDASKRPSRAILIGTQVVEQSLDLDFDVMVSDLAPIDLLCQRLGRLHRHDRQRPDKHRVPLLWLVMPPTDGTGLPTFDHVAWVYDEDVMLRTFAALHGVDVTTIPDDLETWIEKVYGEAAFEWPSEALRLRYDELHEQLQSLHKAHQGLAVRSLLPVPPTPPKSNPFTADQRDLLEEDSSNAHPSLLARTRLGEPTLDLVCLWETPRGLCFDRQGTRPVPLEPRHLADQQELLAHSLRVERRRLLGREDCLVQPPRWQEFATLRNYSLLVLGERSASLGIELDPELGAIFHRRTS